ncbi:MAG: 3-phosphoshikimate 1-carboxyvinyltransferase [Actinomycetota bacterium]|nr:3-phosphoshikimate 1-carboxyvinyltransferase [Actinomycetota bacterium]
MTYRVLINGPQKLSGRLAVPGDKSITHRALILSAMAFGRARISNILTSTDCLSTLDCLRRLGVEIELDGEDAIISGCGLTGLAEPDDVLDVGNSGTALRILPALLAGQEGFAVITGDRSIRKRPVDRVLKPLVEMGAKVWARDGGRLAPVAVSGGPLRGIVYRLPVASAQVKTAVLLAGLPASGRTTVIEPVTSRDHTEIMLEYLGAAIAVEADRHSGERHITVTGETQFQSKDIGVPGDFSSAAFFLAAGALVADEHIEIINLGLNPTRTGFIEVLEKMGGAPESTELGAVAGEPVGSVGIGRARLVGTDIGGSMIPRLIDELPLVALLATQAQGRTTVKDAAELRVKETDRIALTAAELNKLGAKVTPTDDGFIIDGPTPLKGTAVESHGDHRLAMMLAVAALSATGATVIAGAGAVDVSFPDFFDRLRQLGAECDRIAKE